MDTKPAAAAPAPPDLTPFLAFTGEGYTADADTRQMSASERHDADLTAAYNRFAKARDDAWKAYTDIVANASEAFDLDVINAHAAYDAAAIRDAQCTSR